MKKEIKTFLFFLIPKDLWEGKKSVNLLNSIYAFGSLSLCVWASQVVLGIKNLPANAGDTRVGGSIPGSGRSLGGENGNAIQYSFLENSTDRGAWWATVHEVLKSQTWLSDWAHTISMYMNISVCLILTMTLWSTEVNYYFIPILLQRTLVHRASQQLTTDHASNESHSGTGLSAPSAPKSSGYWG